MADPQPSPGAALDELQLLLRAVSAEGSPPRHSAVRYTICRAALLESQLRPALPGFVVQCVSISKFHEFITLYDPGVEARTSFVDRAFKDCKLLLDRKPIRDAFSDSDF